MLAILFVAPLPLGSNRDWAWGPLAVIVGIAALILSIGMALGDRRDGHPLATLAPAAVAFTALVVWAFLQSGTLTGGLGSNPLIDETLASLGRAGPHRIGSDVEGALTGIMLWLAYAAVFWIAVEAARDARQARRILITLVVSGVVTTFYGFLTELAASLKGIWSELIPSFGSGFSGTFANRNHYATYVGLCVLIAVALIGFEAPHSASQSPPPLRLRLRRFAMRLSSTAGVYVAALVILFAGLLQSSSRGGLLSLLSGLLVYWMLGRRRPLVAFGALFVLIGLVLALPSAGTLLDRFAWVALGSTDEAVQERLGAYQTALEAIALRPWTGWGLGSFADAYTLLQPVALADKYFNYAHNTYLELAVELGVPFAAVLPAIVLWIVGRCFLGMRERSRHREMPAVAIAATALVGVHSLVDFSLQIPAVAVAFAAILGIGWAQSWSSRRDNSS